MSHTVVGVLPPDFRLFLPPEVYAIREGDLYTPLQIDRANLPPRNLTTLTVFGRIKPGVTLAQAQDEMNRVAAQVPRHLSRAQDVAGADQRRPAAPRRGERRRADAA